MLLERNFQLSVFHVHKCHYSNFSTKTSIYSSAVHSLFNRKKRRSYILMVKHKTILFNAMIDSNIKCCLFLKPVASMEDYRKPLIYAININFHQLNPKKHSNYMIKPKKKIGKGAAKCSLLGLKNCL